ncbi:MAG: DNA-directed RNA polymerase subunit alpha C-terminal domain-containing protein [Bacteroidia bacterium]
MNLITLDERLNLFNIDERNGEVLKRILLFRHTYDAVAKDIGITTQRVEQIYKTSLMHIISSIEYFFEKYKHYETLKEVNYNLTQQLAKLHKKPEPSEHLQSVLKLRLEDLDITVRTMKVMKFLKFETVADLLTIKPKDLLKIQGVYFGVIKDIRRELAAYGVKF